MKRQQNRDYAVSIDALVTGLASQIDALVVHLLPNATKEGHEWMVGSTAGERGRSMAINRSARAGVWMDFGAAEGGDALDLVAAVLFQKNKTEAIKWAKSWLGLDGADPYRLKVYRQDAELRAKQRTDEDLQSEAKTRHTALSIWRDATHRIADTPVEAYLRGRAIDLRPLGRQPGVLAYAAKCYCKDVNRRIPAMVAEIRKGKDFAGIHRTYLEVLRDGRVVKASVVDAKKSLGRYVGGCIPLWRGADPRRWADLWDDGPDETLVITEGIENALSIVIADPSRRVAATVSLSNMAALELPATIKTIIIARDNDEEGSKAALAYEKAVDSHYGQGRIVKAARAPAPHKDFNDWLQALRRLDTTTPGGAS